MGYVLTSAACLALEWRHRRRFAARCQWESRGADPAVFDALLLQAPGLILLHLLCKGALAVALCYTPG